MRIKICPYCLEIIQVVEPYYDGKSIKPAPTHIGGGCGCVVNEGAYKVAKLSSIQAVKTRAGKISKTLNLSDEQKKEVFKLIKEIKRKNPKLKDYKVLEMAFNKIINKEGKYE